MKAKMIFVAVIAALLAGYGVSYHTGHKRAALRAVTLARDSEDVAQPTAAKTEFDPFLTRGNPIPRDLN